MLNHKYIVQRRYRDRDTGEFVHKYFGGKGRWYDDPHKARLYNFHAARSVAGMFVGKEEQLEEICYDVGGLNYLRDTAVTINEALRQIGHKQ